MPVKVILVHGFGVNLHKKLNRKPIPEGEEFKAFKLLVQTGSAKVFRWGIHKKLNPLQVYSLKAYSKVYKNEKLLAQSENLQLDLFKMVQNNEEVETVICHSLGCSLFMNSINKFGLKNKIKKIVLISADLPRNWQITNPDIKARIQKNELEITNIFCITDYTLFVSSIYNKYIPAGLFGLNIENIKNKIWFTNNLFSPHGNAIGHISPFELI